uniref:F-box associated domain-containing protein n=1 Tax=Aegilops tauschii TaxID=37682 RepID=N1R475_AEGTA
MAGTGSSSSGQTEAGGIRDCKHPDAIVSRGKVHWSVRNWYPDYSLDMGMETFHISQTMFMDRTTYSETNEDPQLAVTAEGTPLVLLLSRPGLQLKVCTRQDGRKSENGAVAKAMWLTTRTVELKPPSLIKRRPEKIYLRLLGEKSGTMLLKDSQRQIYVADVETGEMEEFELPDGFDGLNRRKVVLLEMDWLALFVSRLRKW